MWVQREIRLHPRPRGFHLVTREVLEQQIGIETWLGKLVVTLADRFRQLEDSSPGTPRS